MGEVHAKVTAGGWREGVSPPEEIIFGRSVLMAAVRQRLEKVAAANIPVLIEGEGGTGKELLAWWIHAHSPMKAGEFVKVSCAAIPGTLLESELFGYEAGAFTGAHNRKIGRVELAHRGTLFLDEIAEIEHGFQAKLLQFLQDGRFCKIGDQQDTWVETRIICATNRRLELDTEGGRFRGDLFYRINGVRIQLPRLRDRREDIADLAEYFVGRFSERFEKQPAPLSRELLDRLRRYDWPGNIRELENRMARYVILGDEEGSGATPSQRRVPLSSAAGKPEGAVSLKQIARDAVRETERKLIMEVLKANHWNRRKAAEALRISYRALIYKIRDASLKGSDAGKIKAPGRETARPPRTAGSEASG